MPPPSLPPHSRRLLHLAPARIRPARVYTTGAATSSPAISTQAAAAASSYLPPDKLPGTYTTVAAPSSISTSPLNSSVGRQYTRAPTLAAASFTSSRPAFALLV